MDRFFKGLISGMIGGATIDIWGSLAKYALGFSARDYVDWASVVMYGHLPHNILEFLFGLIAHILWSGFLGVLFSYFIHHTVSQQGFRTKGAFFGFITGFLLYGAAILWRMPFFAESTLSTSIANTIGGFIWGIVTSEVIHRLDRRFT